MNSVEDGGEEEGVDEGRTDEIHGVMESFYYVG